MLGRPMGFQIGQVVCGRYEILGLLPAPPFGELYRAQNRDLGVESALLVLGPSLLPDESARQDLIARVSLARGLRQPNLIWLYDVRAEGAEVVVAAQWAGVDTLRARMKQRKAEKVGWPRAPAEAWSILQQVAHAVQQLHRDAEALGDLRADTIVVTPEGLKLFNHGVGCGLPRARFVEVMERAGEEMFVAPEVRGGSAPSSRADVYSLGALMHELVFGEPPSVEPPYLSPRSVTRPQLSALLLRTLDPEPFERPLSIDALLREMQQVIDEAERPMPAAPTPAPAPAPTDGLFGAERTVIGEVKLPPAVAAAVERAKAAAEAAASGGLQSPEASGWGGHNEAVTRQIELSEVESLLGKNETRQIELSEIETLLAQSKDPSLDPAPEAAAPKKETPRPSLFSTQPAPETPLVAPEPVILLKPEDKKTGEMGPVLLEPGTSGQFAGTAPPPLWEDVRSSIERGGKRRRSPLLFIFIVLVVAGLAGGAGWLYVTGKWATLPGIGKPTGAVEPPPVVVEAKPVEKPVEAKPAEKPVEAKPIEKPVAVPPPAAERCPAGSAFVDGPKPGCIDLYEYPGEAQLPRVNVSFLEAAQLCSARGARLCGEVEWERACRGPSSSAYPYGAAFAAGKCNVKGAGGKLLPSGSVASCKSASGAFDLSGNAAEWVIVEPQQMPAIKGGSALAGEPDVSCAAKLEAKSLAGGPLVGFRCCRDAK